MITVERYGESRFFSIHEDRILVSVCVYKRGALGAAFRLAELTGKPVQVRTGHGRGTYWLDAGRICRAA